jgi:hypothetical protein
VEFAFTEDQLAFCDAVRDLLAKECPPEVVRSAWPEGPSGEGARASAEQVDKVWHDLAEMGVLGIAVPEEQGGLGLTEVDWILLAEETGYAALPHPFVEAVCGLDSAAEVRDSIDGSRARAITGGEGEGLLFDRIALGTAAQLVGLGRRMLDMTVAYAIERKQFGVAIGSQQAVKHHLADAALQLQFAAPAVYRAAWSMSTGAETATRDVSMAKAMASDAARLVGRKALQVHGAIGYTVEYDLHLYFKRAEALARSWGDAAWHRRRVADALGL